MKGEMNMKELTQKEKCIKGLKIRTDNQSIDEIIGLWQKVPEMELSGEIFAVYSNYESDHTGKYDLLIGSSESTEESQVIINKGKYLVFELPSALPEKIGEVWQKIWSDESIYEKRLFTTDFEHYLTDGSGKIYLAIK